MSDEEKSKNCTFTFKRGRGGRANLAQRKRQQSGSSSSSSEDETMVVKQSRERKVNPMVQKSHLFKKFRRKEEDEDSDGGEENPAVKGHGTTSVDYKTSGAEIKDAAKENAFATRNIDTEQEKDFRSITERWEGFFYCLMLLPIVELLRLVLLL